MNQNEYEEMFREEENAPAEAGTSTEAQNQKVPEQTKSITTEAARPLCDLSLNDRIYMGLSDVAFSAIRHQKFWDIAYHLEKIREILEGEK